MLKTVTVTKSNIFKRIARKYIYEHPSDCHDLNRYGSRFAEFIDGWEEAKNQPFLSDLARLDWAWSECLDFEEDVPLTFPEFETIFKTRDPERIVFVARKSSTVVTTAYTVLEFWKEFKDGEAELVVGGEKLQPGLQHLLVWKDRRQRRVQEIEAELWPVVSALQNKSSLKALSELPAVLKDPVRLKESLQVLLTRGWLSRSA